MANRFQVEVMAADRKLYSGEAVSLVAPGADGYFGVLWDHAPLVSALQVGEIEITPVEKQPPVIIAVSGGFIEVQPDRVTVLADSAELAQNIDIERARMAKERAEAHLQAATENTDVARAQAALLRALNRLRVAERRGGHA